MTATESIIDQSFANAKQAIDRSFFTFRQWNADGDFAHMPLVVFGPRSETTVGVYSSSEAALSSYVTGDDWVRGSRGVVARDELQRFLVWNKTNEDGNELNPLRRLRSGLRHLSNPHWWHDADFYARIVNKSLYFATHGKRNTQSVFAAGELDLKQLFRGQIVHHELVFLVESGLGDDPMTFHYDSAIALRDGDYYEQWVERIAPYVVSRAWFEKKE